MTCGTSVVAVHQGVPRRVVAQPGRRGGGRGAAAGPVRYSPPAVRGRATRRTAGVHPTRSHRPAMPRPAPPLGTPIERVAAPAPADLDRRYLRTGTPVVLTGLYDRAPAAELRDPAVARRVLGALPLRVTPPPISELLERRRTSPPRATTFARFLADLDGGSRGGLCRAREPDRPDHPAPASLRGPRRPARPVGVAHLPGRPGQHHPPPFRPRPAPQRDGPGLRAEAIRRRRRRPQPEAAAGGEPRRAVRQWAVPRALRARPTWPTSSGTRGPGTSCWSRARLC